MSECLSRLSVYPTGSKSGCGGGGREDRGSAAVAAVAAAVPLAKFTGPVDPLGITFDEPLSSPISLLIGRRGDEDRGIGLVDFRVEA
jgi:hypothetical protein